jgi:dGTPase
LVEAADDICYNIIDMEDAHRLGIVKTEPCEELFTTHIESVNADDIPRVRKNLEQITNENERISYLRAKVINSLISKTKEIYIKHIPQILDGSLNKSLLGIFGEECDALEK